MFLSIALRSQAAPSAAPAGTRNPSEPTSGNYGLPVPTNSLGLAPNIFDKLALLLSREIREIDRRRDNLSQETQRLPAPPRGQQGNRLGYHSTPTGTNDTKWIILDLGRPVHIDSIVLVPADVAYDTFPGPGYGFPPRFRVDVADNAAFERAIVVTDNTRADFPNPGDYPVQLMATGTTARYVRLTATRLWLRSGRGIFALGELMVLSGALNVAAGLPPSAIQTSDSREQFPAWTKMNLVDGQSVLGAPMMGPISLTAGFQSEPTPRADMPKWVQVDLGREYDLQEIRLYPARPRAAGDQAPFGFPWEMRIETDNNLEFNSPALIFALMRPSAVRPSASPVTVRAEGYRGRFVRVTATWLAKVGPPFAFSLSELQVYAEGENVAQGAPVAASDSLEGELWARRYLVDGFNSQQRLVEWPEWIRAVARRGDNERELHELGLRRDLATYAMIGSFVRWTSYLAAGVLLLAALFIWRSHLAKQRALEGLRTRIARDIHDDIGSGLGTIAMLSQMAQRQLARGAQPKEDLEEIHRVACDLSDSMRDIAWLNRSDNGSLKELYLRMRETAKTMLPNVALEFPFNTKEGARRLSLEAKRQLFLIFKEALHNILKHAKATCVEIRLACDHDMLILSVQDNGQGFDALGDTSGTGLSSMRERAEALHGKFSVDSHPGKGAVVTVCVPSKSIRRKAATSDA